MQKGTKILMTSSDAIFSEIEKICIDPTETEHIGELFQILAITPDAFQDNIFNISVSAPVIFIERTENKISVLLGERVCTFYRALDLGGQYVFSAFQQRKNNFAVQIYTSNFQMHDNVNKLFGESQSINLTRNIMIPFLVPVEKLR
jgi:hypothetical protein